MAESIGPPSEGPLYQIAYPSGVNVRRAPRLDAPIATSVQFGGVVESLADSSIEGWIRIKPQEEVGSGADLWMKLFVDNEPIVKRIPSKRGIFGGLMRHINCYHSDPFVACSCKCRTSSSSLAYETTTLQTPGVL